MATVTNGYSFGATERVTNTKLHSLLTDATVTAIANADIASDAAIELSKLAASTAAYIIVHNGSGVPVAVQLTQAASISNAGVLTLNLVIFDGAVVTVDEELLYFN